MSAGRVLTKLLRLFFPKDRTLTTSDVLLAQHFAYVRICERQGERLHGSPACQDRIKAGFSLMQGRVLAPNELAPAFRQAEVAYRMEFMGNYKGEALPAPPPKLPATPPALQPKTVPRVQRFRPVRA